MFYQKYVNVAGSTRTLPVWGKWLVFLVALPGLLILLLSLLAVGVSILALLLTAGPVLWLVLKVASPSLKRPSGQDQETKRSRKVDVTVVR